MIRIGGSGAVGGGVFVDHTEQGSEITHVGVVTEKEPSDVAETEARLVL